MKRFRPSKAASLIGSSALLRLCVLAGWLAATVIHADAAQPAVDLRIEIGPGSRMRTETLSGYQRAGQAGAGIVVVPEVQTIDASDVDTSLLGLNHSYFADNSTIVSDLFTLLKGLPPQERFGVTPITIAAGTYWRFKAAAR